MTTEAEVIVAKIVADIASRSMVGLAWEQIPEEKRAEISAGWLAFFTPAQPTMTDEAVILGNLKRIAELEADVVRLENLVYVPGLLRCAKCKCSIISSTLNVVTGLVKANEKPQGCPNGCGPLWRVTERDAGNELADRMNDVRNSVLEQAAFIAEAYATKPKPTVLHFLGQIAQDIKEADEGPKRAAGREVARLIRSLKGPA